jgi:hypothetical protein
MSKHIPRNFQLIIIALLGALIQACTPPSPPACPATDLLLDKDALSLSAQAGPVTAPLPDSTIYSAGRTYYLGQGIANHDIYPYSSEHSASNKFEGEALSPAFAPSSSQWESPDNFADVHLAADRYQVGCGSQHDIPMCKFIAQYRNYFVSFNVHTYPGEVSVSEVRALVEAIDQKMSRCFQNSDN